MQSILIAILKEGSKLSAAIFFKKGKDMGYNSDYMAQSMREALLQETAQLYLGALKILGLNASKELIAASQTYYCTADYVAEFCEFIKNLSDEDKDRTVWAKTPLGVKTANWWMTHCLSDSERMALENSSLSEKEVQIKENELLIKKIKGDIDKTKDALHLALIKGDTQKAIVLNKKMAKDLKDLEKIEKISKKLV